ncbi:hypothetical protein GLOIN_2v1769762 [Rhizophagus clarus]|uniref:RING-type domain-containing protein n=1 Tax=Rhizophagus clarus TaxID=94130 RepID=A0A8H3LWN0_9GLOM|nr:hypothetical protein GLOIN_2v1769762 [Rhizophagus clarus]
MTGTESTKDSSYQIPKRPHLSLTNYRNFAYSILKYLEDDMVGDKEIPELESCSECTMNILSLPIKALTILSCGHIFHRSCIEKQLLHTKPSTCPSPDCKKNVNIIVDPSFISEKFVLNLPAIPAEDPMESIEDSAIPRNQLLCAKCLEEITADFPKDTGFLSCKHVVHYDCIGNPHKKCPTCSGKDLIMLEKLIEELISETSQDPEIAKEGIPPLGSGSGTFFDLYNVIDVMEGQEEVAKWAVIKSYFNFGKALNDQFSHYLKTNPKRTAQALVNQEV